MNRQLNTGLRSGMQRNRYSRGSYQIHRGTSLIETIVTISVASTLFLLSTAWIHQSFFVASKMRDQGRHHDSLMRLSRQFRDDVHSSASIEMINETDVRMSSAIGSIEYEVKENLISRSVYQADDASLVAQETFGLLGGAEASCELKDDWFTLTIIRTRGHRLLTPNSDEPTRPSDLHVRARVGRWLNQLPLPGDS